jgi:hypothetical protein
LPIGPFKVKLTKYNGCFTRVVFFQIIAANLVIIRLIYNPNVRVLDLPKRLPTNIGFMHGNHDGDPLHRCGQAGEIDINRFIITISITTSIIARMLNGAAGRSNLIIEDKVSINAEASRSNSCPSLARGSQPRPTDIFFNPGAALARESFCPLDKVIDLDAMVKILEKVMNDRD